MMMVTVSTRPIVFGLGIGLRLGLELVLVLWYVWRFTVYGKFHVDT